MILMTGFGLLCNARAHPGQVLDVKVISSAAGQLDSDSGVPFESMFRAHYDDLTRFALRRVGPDAAADVVADVFAVAWRRRQDVPAGAERLWLFGVAANVIANEHRSAQRRTRLLRRITAEP